MIDTIDIDLDDIDLKIIKSLTLAKNGKDLFINYLTAISSKISESLYRLPKNQCIIRDHQSTGKLVPVNIARKESPWVLLKLEIFEIQAVPYPVWICQKCPASQSMNCLHKNQHPSKIKKVDL